jgi:hypothetical protein
MYHDFDHLLARERMTKMRKEVDGDRLARLARRCSGRVWSTDPSSAMVQGE